MIDLEKYAKLKTKADQARSAVHKAEGALEEQLKKLKEEFGVDNEDAAQALLTQLEQEAATAEAAYNTELAKFEEKWGKL